MSANGKTESAEAIARREEIVEAARELFEERGLAHTTVKDIADRVGVTRSLFYHYFPDKDAVTEAVLDAYIEEFREMVGHWNEGREPGNVRKALHDCIRMLRRGVFDKGQFRSDLIRNENASLYLVFSARSAEVLARYLTETTAVDYERFHELDIENVYDMFYMLIVGMVGYVRSHPDAPDELLENLIAQTLHLDLDNEALTAEAETGWHKATAGAKVSVTYGATAL
ncbi:MAG: TetR/AcrR family transcriptional regulator [Eggerthellaceae bacterium]|nr:TetR/AcrR family transcriptional regulator [Eggerthellaceae bacterium]